MIDILSALDILQKNGIANRDIKPDNFILIREDNVFKYKLTDFGIGIKLLENSSNLVYFATIQGFSKDFASPEVLEYALESRDFEENEQYDPFLADVYSLGVTVLFMMGMSLQFINEVRKLKSEDLVNSLQVFFKEGKYDLICEILGDMLHKDPTKRKTFLQIREMVESKANNVMIQQPEETNIVNKIEKCRKENTNSFAYVENCIKFARLYYSIGDMEEAGHYAKEANDKVELCNSCYDMEILRLRGLIFREAGDYGRAEKFSHRYHQILEIYKEKTHYIHDQKKSLQKNWSEVFQRLDKDEKADFLKMFWKFHS